MKALFRNLIQFLFPFLLLFFQLELGADDLAEKKNIEDLIDKYFATWSNIDMEGYESCFHPNAIIHFERSGDVKEDKLSTFIAGQKNAHAYAQEKMKEVPLSKKIQFDKGTAQVTVRWKLTANNREQYGYDYFTLIQLKKKWKIIYLIFHND